MAVEIRYKVVPLMKTFFCGKLLWSRKNLFFVWRTSLILKQKLKRLLISCRQNNSQTKSAELLMSSYNKSP